MPFKLQVVATDPLETKADLAVYGAFEQGSSAPLAALQKAFGAGLKELVAQEDFKGKRDQKLSIPTVGRLPVGKVALLGLGDPAKLTDAHLRLFGAAATKLALAERAESVAITVPEGITGDRLRYLAEGATLGAYRFTKYFTGDRKPKRELARVTLVMPRGKPIAREQKAAALGAAIGQAVSVSRDLQNEPPNELTPIALANVAARVAKQNGLKVTVFDRRKLEQTGMKLFIAVAQGSVNEPRLVHMTYTPPRKARQRIVIVGKGLTFDSGGLCIKPAQGMGEMKTDMSGAANVVGLMAAVAALKLDIEVHGILGCAENMPDGAAYRPGDVFGSLDGKTVEIINTDAEGRLVLADCLAYARSLKPDLIIDNATLTGACVVALGTNCSAFFTGNDSLADSFAQAAREAGEQFWRLPLLEDLKESLKSDIADLKHTGDRFGGSITAALFLREFVGDIPWIHCDIAGPALANRAYGIYPKGGTGHGVLTFLRMLENSQG
jgi:leucyl aminopeptidase